MLDAYGFCQRVLQAVQSTETDMDRWIAKVTVC